MRQIRFNHEKEIAQKVLKMYLKEAIINQQAGRVIKADKNKELHIPRYLKEALNHDLALKSAFDQLNLSKKRDFAEYIETAKQESTKNRRLQKIIPMIHAGIGLNDRYK
ncbi:MAG: YdeI/OmpD-associated family protein [Saprospiraceae bacterium]|nr:YdeI/OmpD-associated family protein [Saprospiraceae bacterium]